MMNDRSLRCLDSLADRLDLEVLAEERPQRCPVAGLEGFGLAFPGRREPSFLFLEQPLDLPRVLGLLAQGIEGAVGQKGLAAGRQVPGQRLLFPDGPRQGVHRFGFSPGQAEKPLVDVQGVVHAEHDLSFVFADRDRLEHGSPGRDLDTRYLGELGVDLFGRCRAQESVLFETLVVAGQYGDGREFGGLFRLTQPSGYADSDARSGEGDGE